MTETRADSTTELECPQCGAPVIMPEYTDLALCQWCGSTLARRGQLWTDEDQEGAIPAPATADARALRLATLSATPEIRPHGVAAPDEQVLHSVQCPQCAGPLGAREGRRILVCSHCGVRVAARERGGITRWYFPSRLNRLQAAAAGADWLRDYPGIAKRARLARCVEAQLVYAPIWEHRVLLAGWEFGQKVRTRVEAVGTDGRSSFGFFGEEDDAVRLELQTVKEEVKEPRLLERRFHEAAADFDELGARRPLVTGRELVLPLLAGELEPNAIVLEAKGSAGEIIERARRAAKAPLSGAVRPDSHLFTFRESVALLYYPLWVVNYRTNGRIFRMVVNGRTGAINSATAPASNDRRVLLLAAQTIIAAAVVAVLVWLTATRDTARESLVAAAVIVFGVAAFLIWRFRMVGEVEYHEPFSG